MFEENEDPRNLDSIWNDIEEYEIPETTFNNVTGDYINALTVKIVSATNHYSLLCQYEPGLILEIFSQELRADEMVANRKRKVNSLLSDQSKIPNSHKRTKDLMVAYIESQSGKNDLMKYDEEIFVIRKELIVMKIKLERLLSRKKSIENVIAVGIAILNNYKGD